ncbi:hypothetical protein SERLA73DRAFT_91497 [Serpula lacrymans var. lacrymans S7.3]|uniref:Uncharacterized protein n=2 Tax=Serpula lacrymans var. lacrymans TaxID=341189 RepID=F8Q1Q3_SERL3|nr:uncharacterized protein SERLADRAFT_450124 [Serpula lacrymans var. lacrymans S7.9]EGN98231.1 hypothetical protein SERLA73DRAFT_91497 [Serpula lacrymans var. lacrymans S7.3]EGO23805.1 hypothetical protein SERLADRAFT_450124 [Serpula lacrymans var. lacrymans S7.9]
MPSDSGPPPIYSQECPNDTSSDSEICAADPQIIIVPTTDAINFQRGYLGADGERAAIEGELQIKGAEPRQWKKVTMSFRVVEAAYSREIELFHSEIDLFPNPLDTSIIPSSFPFAIPLTPDTPQCVHTPQSSISHALMATLHPLDPLGQPISKTVTVHTRRYASPTYTLETLPETYVLEYPTRVDVEVPRTAFKVGEPIPIYVTIPPPTRELVVDKGWRIRNVKAELVRTVKVKKEHEEDIPYEFYGGLPSEQQDLSALNGSSHDGPSCTAAPSTEDRPSSYQTTICRSGGSCRFHSSRSIRLRFVLHQPSPSASPPNNDQPLLEGGYALQDNDTQCVSISQTTLLHSVTFHIAVHVSFVDVSSRTERVFTVSIPVSIVPPPAPFSDFDTTHPKKRDYPIAVTRRPESIEVSAPRYQEGEAGPSYAPSGAPPPFEERDIPPPPFFSPEPSSSGLPNFLESESQLYARFDTEEHSALVAALDHVIEGEGSLFGFSSSHQFDGYSDDTRDPISPPPTLEMATHDRNLSDLIEIGQPNHDGLVSEHEDPDATAELPPPPPALDDPSDPPPSIDSDFRSPVAHPSTPNTAFSQLHPTYPHNSEPSHTISSDMAMQGTTPSHGHAPPPYLIPHSGSGGEELVARPPPYMFLMPPPAD